MQHFYIYKKKIKAKGKREYIVHRFLTIELQISVYAEVTKKKKIISNGRHGLRRKIQWPPSMRRATAYYRKVYLQLRGLHRIHCVRLQ